MSIQDPAAIELDTTSLHNRAHAVVHAQRDEDDWWGAPMETALVAVADSQHSPGSRTMAEPAYERLLRWLNEESPRALGDDAAAVALAARAGRALRGGNTQLTEQAVALVANTCGATEPVLAPLHVALMAWALDALVQDRGRQPWEEVRRVLQRLPVQGVDDALVRFAQALADQGRPAMDARLADVDTVNRTDESILLWVLSAAIAVEADRGDPDSLVLGTLLRRRAELLDHLGAVLEGEAVLPVATMEYDPFTDTEEESEGLHLFEAVMLDLALSGERPRNELISLEEAKRLGRKATDQRRVRYAEVSAGASVVFTAMAVVIAVLAKAPTRAWVGILIVLLPLGLAGSLLFLRELQTKWNLELLITGLCLVTLLGVFFIIEALHGKPLVSDEAAAVIGIVFVFAPLLLQTVVARALKR
jgi:hypothetical protein